MPLNRYEYFLKTIHDNSFHVSLNVQDVPKSAIYKLRLLKLILIILKFKMADKSSLF